MSSAWGDLSVRCGSEGGVGWYISGASVESADTDY